MPPECSSDGLELPLLRSMAYMGMRQYRPVVFLRTSNALPQALSNFLTRFRVMNHPWERSSPARRSALRTWGTQTQSLPVVLEPLCRNVTAFHRCRNAAAPGCSTSFHAQVMLLRTGNPETSPRMQSRRLTVLMFSSEAIIGGEAVSDMQVLGTFKSPLPP